jgi:wobble nucleotide-excising tRNase
MSQTLRQIAEQLRDANKKVQLIYAFNGSGKTRLSREFKELISPKNKDEDDALDSRSKILYYNAFTEDLFYWDNDLAGDAKRVLKIQPNAYTQWVFQNQGQDRNTIAHFQRYTSDKLTPSFNADFSEVSFSFQRGNDQQENHIKISKGEESNFIWSIFYSLIKEVVSVLSVADPSQRESDKYDLLQYIFIDDPVSSLDENHLIELAVDVAELIKSSVYANGQGLRFIVTTHNPLFYNILWHEFNGKDPSVGRKDNHWKKYRLAKHQDSTFSLEPQPNDSPFSYHLFLKAELDKAADTGVIRKYHFNFLRNILEKTSTFVGTKHWAELLPSTDGNRPNPYLKRILNLSSHSKHSGEEVAEPNEDDKRVFKFLVKKLNQMYQLKMRSE